MAYGIAIATKGKEYLYKKNTGIKCNSKNQALVLCNHLNENNKTACGSFKCNDDEIWHIFDDLEPMYKVKATRRKIIVMAL